MRLAGTAWWHTTEWSVGLTVRATRRPLEVAMAPEKAGDVVPDLENTARSSVRSLLGLADLDGRVRDMAESNDMARKVAETMPRSGAARKVVEAVPGVDAARRVAGSVVRPSDGSRRAAASGNGHVPLNAQEEELLYKSRDVHYEEDAHPAYERLVESLAPDEARILLLLDGPQPAVDVRTGGPLGLLNSRLLAPG